MKTLKKKLLVFTAFVLAAGMMTSCGSSSGSSGGAVTAPALPAAVTTYVVDYMTMDWVKVSTIEYEYQGDRIASRIETYEGGEPLKSTFEFREGDNQKPLLQQYDNDSSTPSKEFYYDESGRMDRVFTYSADGASMMQQVYQYGNEDAYFTLVLHETEIIDPEDPAVPLRRMEEVDSLEITTNGELLAKTVNNGLYANWTEGDEKVWSRFNGTYTAEYDENGILSETDAVYRESTSGKEYKFDVTVEDGRVIEVVRSRFTYTGEGEEEGEWFADSKLVFTYTDIETTPAKYAAMINAHILGEGNGYYIYNWY